MESPGEDTTPSGWSIWHADTPRAERWARSALVLTLTVVAAIQGVRGWELLGVTVMAGVLLRLLPPDLRAWVRQPARRPANPQSRPSRRVPYEEGRLQTWVCALDVDEATIAERLGLEAGRRVAFREGLRAATDADSVVFVVALDGHVAVFSGEQIGLGDWHERASHPVGRAFCAYLDEGGNNGVLAYAEDGAQVRLLSGDPDHGLTTRGEPRPGEPALGDDARYSLDPWWAVVNAWGGLAPTSLADRAAEGTLYERGPVSRSRASA